LGNLTTPQSVQKLQTALHAKAKAEAGYRFYALYDKISREDILAHAYAQCRSNKGAPGVDGQDFEDIEAYGVQRWLGETGACAQAGDLPTGPYQTSVHTEGQRQTQGRWASRPCVIRVCMTAAMLVLEPIFEADLPPELYAYRPGETPKRRWSRWKSCCFVATRKSWTPTSRTTSEVFPMPSF